MMMIFELVEIEEVILQGRNGGSLQMVVVSPFVLCST